MERLQQFGAGPLPNCNRSPTMGIVINFPTKGCAAKSSAVAQPVRATARPAPAPSLKTERTHSTGFKVKAISLLLLKGVWASVWLVLACLWLMGRWLAGIDLCFQLIRTAYFWNTPNVYAGWTFLLHFAVFTFWTYLVGVYRPAGFRDLPPVLAAKKG
jgi:Uncharacterized KleE stable inheritance protein